MIWLSKTTLQGPCFIDRIIVESPTSTLRQHIHSSTEAHFKHCDFN